MSCEAGAQPLSANALPGGRFTFAFARRGNAVVGDAIHLGAEKLVRTLARKLAAADSMSTKLFGDFGRLDHLEFARTFQAGKSALETLRK
jgi:hypothetical protein